MSSWALGWVYGRGNVIEFEEQFLDVALKLYQFLGGKLERVNSKTFRLTVDSALPEPTVDIDFVRGLFESNGVWGNRSLFIPAPESLRSELRELLKPFSPKETEEGFFVVGAPADLLLHLFYDEETEERSEFYFEKFLSYLTGGKWERKAFRFSLEEGALPPFKKRISDSGFDLYLIKLLKVDGNVYFFDTGVRVAPPPGFYFDLVPRSSIYKSGFVLANSVGIIDMTYRGTVKVPLVKVNPEKEVPELPWRAVQLIPRRFYPLEAKQVENLEETVRGEGGFGSTG